MEESQLLTGRITEINGNIRSILQAYMTWFTFYWILNGTVMAWFFSGSVAGGVPPLLAVLFFVMTVPSAFSSFMVIHRLEQMISATDALSGAVVDTESLSEKAALLYRSPMWSVSLLRIGLGINGVATAGLALVWLLLLVFPGLAVAGEGVSS